MRLRSFLAGAAVIGVAAFPADAQERTPRPEREGSTRVWRLGDDDDRAVIGVSTSSGSRRDTLGVLITGVTAGGPAEQAGLEEGNRIAAINGVNLRLSAADAGEEDMEGILSRRLSREMRKVKAGDEVELRVYDDGQFKTLRLKTVPASDLNEGIRRVMDFDDWNDRAVVGLQLGGGASVRDTLGLLVVDVASGGPAEKAGIEEGNRIAAIGEVRLTVPREDADDDGLVSARRQRFTRELQKLEAGAEVELRVYANGQFKNVRVKTARAEDVYGERGRRRGMIYIPGDGIEAIAIPTPPTPPIPPIPPIRTRVWTRGLMELQSEIDRAMTESRRGVSAAQRRLLDVQRRLNELQLRRGAVTL
ncbi:MAG TPA: PDZ domain-containing protein [Gemmatimonadaceae bacterium]|nr:PDZ domain-containing protein [Gemmatimonadaceae bacterium]